MEQQDDKLTHIIELRNEIEDKLDKFTLDTIWQTKQDLYSIILRLNNIHNSKLAVNKLIPDVLYNIFAFAVYDSTDPVMAVVDISRVCSYWRKSAIGWPALWGFVDMNKPRSIVDLFMSRSEGAPLSLSWIIRRLPPDSFDSSKRYLESSAEFILPRLHSLTLCFDDTDSALIRDLFYSSGPLPLRYLDIQAMGDIYGDMHETSLSNILQVDVSYLRGFKLRNMDWPGFEFPHNKLTHFSLSYPTKAPSLSTLLVFLSSFPFLIELEIRISNCLARAWTQPEVISIDSSVNPSISINELNFPNLKRLILVSDGESSYDYIRELTARIGSLGRLSQFELTYYLDCWPYLVWDSTLPPFNIFEPVPSGTFSSLNSSDHHYFFLHCNRQVAVVSAPSRASGVSPRPPFYLTGRSRMDTNIFVDYSPIIYWIREMPQITHLDLAYDAWKVLTSLNMHEAFPYLETLGLRNPTTNEALQILPSYLNLKTLIITSARDAGILLPDVFLDAVLRIEVEIVKLDHHYIKDSEFGHAITAVRNRGVDVMALDPDYETVPSVYRWDSF